MITVSEIKHPFLLYEDYLTVNVVKRGRTDKRCEFCSQVIPIGEMHKVHMFVDYETYATHLDCSVPFAATLG